MASHVRSVIPGVALSTDMIVGFCGETEAEFEETLSLMREVRFHKQFIFQYRYDFESERSFFLSQVY